MGRSKLVWLGAAWVLLSSIAALIGFLGPERTSAQERNFGWQQVQNTPPNVDFTNVFMLSGRTDGLVAGKLGSQGVLYGLEIRPLDAWRTSIGLVNLNGNGSNFRAPLNAAVSIADNNVWVVGDKGLIAHKTSGGWAEIPNPVPNANLTALQMLGAGDEGWAAGYLPTSDNTSDPVLLHYTNGRWEQDNSITGDGPLYALHFAEGAGWVVGQPGIWRYRNGAWTKEDEPNPCPHTGCYQTYYSVRAVDQDEAWVAGTSMGICGICVPKPYILHRVGGRWQDGLGLGGPLSDPTSFGWGRELRSITFADPGHGWVAGDARPAEGLLPYIAYYDANVAGTDGRWTYTALPAATGQLNSVIATDMDHAIAVGTNGLLLTFGYGPQPPPTLTPARGSATPGGTIVTPTSTPAPGGSNDLTRRVPDPHSPNVTYFAAVGHTLGGGFRDYWQRHGGLPQFGYPLTEEFTETSPTDGKLYVTQYFERARFEHHPENRPPYDVLLGLLGHTVTNGRAAEAPFQRAAARKAQGVLFFDATGHNVPSQFSGYWQQHGGLPVYGYPISEAFQEVSPTDGKTYLVQYFERNRLEYHPELPDPYRVSLGLLGVQVLQERGWIR